MESSYKNLFQLCGMAPGIESEVENGLHVFRGNGQECRLTEEWMKSQPGYFMPVRKEVPKEGIGVEPGRVFESMSGNVVLYLGPGKDNLYFRGLGLAKSSLLGFNSLKVGEIQECPYANYTAVAVEDSERYLKNLLEGGKKKKWKTGTVLQYGSKRVIYVGKGRTKALFGGIDEGTKEYYNNWNRGVDWEIVGG